MLLSLRTIVDILFPKICRHCGDRFEAGLSNILCSACFDSIPPYEEPVCSHCGMSLPPRGLEGSAQPRCRDCGEGDYALDQVRSFGAYEGALRIAHHGFKFEGLESLGDRIGERMAGLFQERPLDGAQVLVSVPLSPERERERGYNPAAILAGALEAWAGLRRIEILEKIRSTEPQMSLPRAERLKNPLGAYRVRHGIRVPERVLLVDDVFTTGSTLEECAKVLKRSGALWVGAIVFGRTPKAFVHEE